MAKLIYAAITSLDLYVNDARGEFRWAEPDAEVHGFVNELERPIGTILYGRRMYEIMAVWDTLDTSSEPQEMRDYAQQWRATDKVVYSSTLDAVSTSRTRLERTFDADAVRALVQEADRDVAIGGPTLAAQAFAAGLVDDVHLFLNPVIVGGGTSAMPTGGFQQLELVDERRFASGVVYLHHQVRR